MFPSYLVGQPLEYYIDACERVFAYPRGETELGAFRQEINFLGVEVTSEVGDQIRFVCDDVVDLRNLCCCCYRCCSSRVVVFLWLDELFGL